jgi:hypothetical protein
MRTFSINTADCGTAGSAAIAAVAANAQAKVRNVRGVLGLFTTVSPHDLRAKRLQLADRRMAGEQKLPEDPAAYRMRAGQAKSQREIGCTGKQNGPRGAALLDVVAGACYRSKQFRWTGQKSPKFQPVNAPMTSRRILAPPVAD